MPALSDLGLAEFASTLLTETMASVVSAHAEQEDRLRAVAESATMTPEEYAVLVPASEVDGALASLLPGDDGGTSVVAGGPAPAKDVLAALGIELPKNGLDGDGRLTADGVRVVRDAVAVHLAERHVTALREAARAGIPRVVVDGGRVSAKVTYSMVRESDSMVREGDAATGEDSRAVRATDLGALDPARRLSLRPDLVARLPAATRDVRLLVRPASADNPQDSTVRADVFGEVSLTFRTVV